MCIAAAPAAAISGRSTAAAKELLTDVVPHRPDIP
jgi:hypothetical protein